jgi:hypothetical protein
MKKAIIYSLTAALLVFCFSFISDGQKKPKAGRVCGDPTLPCKVRSNFEPNDLPFDTGKNFVIAESEYFYGLILKSKKLKDWGDCAKPSFPEAGRLSVQQMFPHNKVFALNCLDAGTNYYSGVADHTAFIGVYAGLTLAEANKFLKTVEATGKFPGIRVRRMKIGINGT